MKSINNLKICSSLTLYLSMTSFVVCWNYFCKHSLCRSGPTKCLLWIQTVWYSNGIPERIFQKKISSRQKIMKNFPACRVNLMTESYYSFYYAYQGLYAHVNSLYQGLFTVFFSNLTQKNVQTRVSKGTMYSMEWSIGVEYWSGVLERSIGVEWNQTFEWQRKNRVQLWCVLTCVYVAKFYVIL